MATTRRRRFALIILGDRRGVGVSGLGWWQWTRYESVSGTFQNLGYALQWPMFAGFCMYAYRKFVRYEDEPPLPPAATAMTEIPAGLLPERPAPHSRWDPRCAKYNAYLSELARTDAELAPTDKVNSDAVKKNRTTALTAPRRPA